MARWYARIAGANNDRGQSITTTADGSICVVGYYNTSGVTVYNANGSVFTTLTNSGNNDVFIVKYTSLGICQSATRLAGTLNENTYGVSGTSDGGICVVGTFNGTVTSYNANGTAFGTTLSSASGSDAFILKYA
jgi:hypothetical protein